MRADAARNVDAVLSTGARLLARDSTTGMGLIRQEMPDGGALALPGGLVDRMAHTFTDIEPGHAADARRRFGPAPRRLTS